MISHTTSWDLTPVGHLFKETYAKKTFVAFLNDSKLNLRDIAKTIHHLSLVSASLDTESPLQIEVAAILMMLRSVSYPMYQQLVQDGLTPEQISRNIYTGMRKENLRNAVEQAVYEAIVQAQINDSGVTVGDHGLFFKRRCRINQLLMITGWTMFFSSI